VTVLIPVNENDLREYSKKFQWFPCDVNIVMAASGW